MSKDPPAKKAGLSRSQEPRGEHGLSDDDEAALAAFCDEIALDEVSLEAWSAVHHKLDLELTVRLTAAEAEVGGERELTFVRTLCRTSDGAGRRKERVVRLITWPAHLAAGHVIILTGEGDRQGVHSGDVVIRLHII